jgi:hypothetical protein
MACTREDVDGKDYHFIGLCGEELGGEKQRVQARRA